MLANKDQQYRYQTLESNWTYPTKKKKLGNKKKEQKLTNIFGISNPKEYFFLSTYTLTHTERNKIAKFHSLLFVCLLRQEKICEYKRKYKNKWQSDRQTDTQTAQASRSRSNKTSKGVRRTDSQPTKVKWNQMKCIPHLLIFFSKAIVVVFGRLFVITVAGVPSKSHDYWRAHSVRISTKLM